MPFTVRRVFPTFPPCGSAADCYFYGGVLGKKDKFHQFFKPPNFPRATASSRERDLILHLQLRLLLSGGECLHWFCAAIVSQNPAFNLVNPHNFSVHTHYKQPPFPIFYLLFFFCLHNPCEVRRLHRVPAGRWQNSSK